MMLVSLLGELNKMSKNTLFDKVIDMHTIEGNQILIGRKPIHEVTSNPSCFERLREEGFEVRYPETCFAVMDHIVNTKSRDGKPYKDAKDELMAKTLEENVRDFGITYFAPGSGNGGICHVVFPEQGIIWPGMTAICGDSHTSTWGAFGAIAFGTGSTQLGHALASQTIYLDQRPKVRRINFTGELPKGVAAKDVIMHTIRVMGAKGGNGYAHEYGGEVIDDMNMEERVTMCNMGVEGGAKVAYINPDKKTFDYLYGKPFAPKNDWAKAIKFWRSIASDKDAQYDDVRTIDVSELEPMVSWGTSSDQSIGISERIPADANRKALDYMHFEPGQPILGTPLDVVFIGSCTNGRESDLKAAAEILKGKKVKVRTLIVPGSERVLYCAERMGYEQIFVDAGAEMRYPGCSLCLSMSPDTLMNKERIGATSNRSFEDRAGIGAKTHLMSPYTAAASAIEGAIADPRKYL